MISKLESSSTQNSNETFTDVHVSLNIPQAYSRDVIANVYVAKLGRYVYLSGRITRVSDNPYWGKTAHIYFAPLGKTIAVKWNNVITEEAFVEIKYAGELYPVIINNIDGIHMEITDEWGMSTWVNVTSIVQVLSHQSLAEQWYQIYISNLEEAS